MKLHERRASGSRPRRHSLARIQIETGLFEPHASMASTRTRPDGRNTPSDMRPPHLQLGVLSNAQGSAYVELGNTKAMVGVFGPRESDAAHRDAFTPTGRIHVDVSFVTFPAKSKVGPRKTAEEAAIARTIQSAFSSVVLLEKFPKLVLDINCTVLEKDGSVASALINAATLALIDAGIEMNDMVSSCTVTLQDEDRVALDPTGVEEKAQRGSAVVAISPVRGNVTFVESSGTWEEQLWNDALKMAIVGCAQMDCTMREWLKSRPID